MRKNELDAIVEAIERGFAKLAPGVTRSEKVFLHDPKERHPREIVRPIIPATSKDLLLKLAVEMEQVAHLNRGRWTESHRSTIVDWADVIRHAIGAEYDK